MAQIGSIGNYNEREEEFETYVARMKHYFKANDVPTEKQVSVLLTLIGPKGFALANNLLSPKSLDKCKFDEIVESLTTHYKPKKILIFERYKFQTRNQNAGESIAEYVASIKDLARTCDYGETLNDMLRDRFVIGLSNRATQQTLLTEGELTFVKAVNIAVSREAAIRDIEASHKSNSDSGVHKVNANKGYNKPTKGYNNSTNSNWQPSGQSKQNSKPKNENYGAKPKSKCSGCGSFHWRKDCPFINSECFSCKKTGHISKMCMNYKKSSDTNKINYESSRNAKPDSSEICYDFVFSVDDRVAPIKYPVYLNHCKLSMELDTGSFYSIMSKETFHKTWPTTSERPQVVPFKVPLNVYGGAPLSILGSVRVQAFLKEPTDAVDAQLIIVNNNGPTLLGRGMMKQLDISSFDLNEVHKLNEQDSLVSKYPELFAPGLGCYKDKTFSIAIDDTVAPKFFKARPVPYAMRDKVNDELDRLLKEGIIEPVSHSLWAAPMVPVLKTDMSVRICGDYKLTVNKASYLDSYPIPRVQDLFSNLANGTIFSKLDMSQAYAQLVLDENSSKYTTINTSKGLFKYNRLAFGISSAPGIFQRAMEELFHDLPNIICYLDDILVIGKDKREHDQFLNKVFQRLQTAGLKLRWEKCSIGVEEVTYLGFKIDKEGLHPTMQKVHAIRDAPKPTNVSQLRSYLGLLNFYRRFIPNAATMLEPLNKLLKSNVTWLWGKDQENAFNASKEELINSKALVHFDPTKQIVVSADSSAYGLGAVLYHKIDDVERPVCFVSRTLSPAERNYPQVEKEALAMVYAMRQFHYYLWGQKFTMVTDHKPLLGLFSVTKPIPPLASGRIQRWALIIQAYNFVLIHRSGKLLCTADALSRLPLANSCDSTPVPADWTNLVNFLDWSPVTSTTIKDETRKDPLLSKVLKYCESGWPDSSLIGPDFTPYSRRKDELSLQNGCILWGVRVVVPPNLRDSMKCELHADHSGASRMKELARSYLWWPNLDKDLETLVNSCSLCLENRHMPSKADLHPWEWPKNPWHRLHIDYAGPVDGNYFLVVVDAHSKWVDIHKTTGTSTKDTIKWLCRSFSNFGLPVSIVSDNGPCFTSEEFRLFMKNCGIRHITSAVYKPATNGLAERMVQTFKSSLKKSTEPIQITLDRFLFNYRMTPHSTTGVSPAELMFGRKLRCRLDLLWPTLSDKVAAKQQGQRKNHTNVPRKVDLSISDPIMIRNYAQRGSRWLPATVNEKTGPLSYRCKLSDGGVVKRHQDQIHLRSRSPPPPLRRILPPPLHEENLESSVLEPEVCEQPSGSHVSSETQNMAQSESPNLPRRSSRVRKPVTRLDL